MAFLVLQRLTKGKWSQCPRRKARMPRRKSQSSFSHPTTTCLTASNNQKRNIGSPDGWIWGWAEREIVYLPTAEAGGRWRSRPTLLAPGPPPSPATWRRRSIRGVGGWRRGKGNPRERSGEGERGGRGEAGVGRQGGRTTRKGCAAQ